jgi:hypothetical protein
MQRKKELIQKVLSILEEVSYKEKIEVLANVFISLGVNKMNIDEQIINSASIPDILLQDIKNNGETIANALARQGLIILSWLK